MSKIITLSDDEILNLIDSLANASYWSRFKIKMRLSLYLIVHGNFCAAAEMALVEFLNQSSSISSVAEKILCKSNKLRPETQQKLAKLLLQSFEHAKKIMYHYIQSHALDYSTEMLLIDALKTGNPEAKLFLQSYVKEDRHFSYLTEIMMIEYLQRGLTEIKDLLRMFVHEYVLSHEAQKKLIELAVNGASENGEFLMIYIKNHSLCDCAEIMLVEALAQESNVAKETLQMYVKTYQLCEDADIMLLNLLAKGDIKVRTMAKEVLLDYFIASTFIKRNVKVALIEIAKFSPSASQTLIKELLSVFK